VNCMSNFFKKDSCFNLSCRFMLALFVLLVTQMAVKAEMAEKHKRTFHPEKLAQLYVSAFINGDPASLLQLNSTLTDKENLAKDQSYMRSMAERVAFRVAMGNLTDFTRTAIIRTPTLSQDLQNQLIPFAQAQARAILKTGCRVTESKVLETCWASQPRTVEVYLSCLVPDIPSWKPEAAALPSLPRTYFSALSSAWEGPAIKPLSVKMLLYSTEKGDDWELDSSHDPRGIIAAISASLSPDTWPANRNKYIPGATYMTLNPCIYRGSSDFNNRYVLLSGAFWRLAKPTDLEQVLARYDDALLLVYDSNTTAFHVA